MSIDTRDYSLAFDYTHSKCIKRIVQVCEETLSNHTRRLEELHELVSSIATAVGLDAKALLGGEVEALGKRLEDVRTSLSTLADVAEAKSKTRAETSNELLGTRHYLDSVQKVSL